MKNRGNGPRTVTVVIRSVQQPPRTVTVTAEEIVQKVPIYYRVESCNLPDGSEEVHLVAVET